METDDAAHTEQIVESNNFDWRRERLELSRKLQERYDAGQPLFTKSQLASLAEQIAHKSLLVQIQGMDGKMNWDPIGWDQFEEDETLSISYRPIQRLVIPSPSDEPDELPKPCCSVDVKLTILPSQMTPDQIALAVGKIGAAFEKHEKTWKKSPQCRKLKDTLSLVLTSDVINKIICFGLGDLTPDSDNNEHYLCSQHHSEPRSHIQHAVALTLAQILGDRTGREIRCYSQDPAYTQASIEFLKSRNIVVLNDPQGFLDTDEHTLVFSVAPTVPVKQIVTDLARPAVIIWDNETSPEMDQMDWEHMRFPDGNETWISPWISDPDSTRTRKMEQEEYTSYPFPEDEVAMFENQILVKKPSKGNEDAA
ncbi:hypothetical protein CGRA01v4_02632 [Colletotrichum graminicola]|uniref:SRR1-like domain-containing protein n=1 Tax=Colletotrichum graminicola (strain M1.001 / M2 / FGSC 10212) TaxID=645133 RepID=E3Q489_COLGM|nr:uncharacterized protein GLRG_00545 [Colletotrichum graminicola M1.001]EFQ25401.1 hypothetical protein GLRG_00545 [Colletotrichum graminicola M1.001]WDK11353.1 hypothetical protein CGRA01v4_02632 [Colletotrichum graminicola]